MLNQIDKEVLAVICDKELSGVEIVNRIGMVSRDDRLMYQRSIQKLLDQGYLELCGFLKIRKRKGVSE